MKRGNDSVLKLEGILAGAITPFGPDEKLDEEAFRNLIDFWIENGVSGVVSLGSFGEGPYMSREERKKAAEVVVDQVNRRVPVIISTGSPSTRETISLTKDAKNIGADAAVIVTPYYFKLDEQEMYEHYNMISTEVDFPIVLYNVPRFTNINLSASIITKLVEIENVVAIKECSGSIRQMAEIIHEVGQKISILAGKCELTYPTLMLGGSGAALAIADVAPRFCVDLYKAFKRGDYQTCQRIQLELMPLIDVLQDKYGIAGIKQALNILNKPAGVPRRPLKPLTKQAEEEVTTVLRKLKMLD